MGNVKKLFNEFKSIFLTENVLKENERHANIVTATTMSNLFLVILISWILNQVHVFNVETININEIVINGFLGFFVPASICFILKGEKKWIKYMLFGMFVLVLVTIDNKLTYTTAFLMVIPVIMSARYYRKYFTIFVSILTFMVFVTFAFITGLNHAFESHDIVSALLLYYVVSFASVQVSQSGKNMIRKQEEITKKGTRIETELNLANSIQHHMLPSTFPPFPEHDEIDIYASMTPAKEVGGDFYDMFLLDDNHLVINVADVSGKGIPAALVMMVAKILIKNFAGIEHHADQILDKVNKMLCEGNKEDIFVTVWLGILNLETGRLEYANAGHNPPLLYIDKKEKYEFLKTDPNMAMACFNTTVYDKHEIYIEPNDRLFLYTDGVVEAINTKNELYGENRLKLFLDNNNNLNSKEIIEKLKEELTSYSDGVEQFDDITMLELIYKKKKKEKKGYLEKEFNADISLLPEVQKFINDELKNYKCNKNIIEQFVLVAEEIFINIAKYAYPESHGICTIKLQFTSDNVVICEFEDSGIPFNPLKKKDPDIDKSIKERKIGGLGIYISKKIMDNMEYEYKDNKNILRIMKKK